MTAQMAELEEDALEAQARAPVDRFMWERIIRRAPLLVTTRALALTLATYADKNGTNIFPGNDRLVAVLRVNEKTVRRHLTHLRDGGYIFRVYEHRHHEGSRRGWADEYVLTVPPDFTDRPGVLHVSEEPI